MSLNLSYVSKPFADAANLTNDEWLVYRKTGIGGSDASATLKLSPWMSIDELYYNKVGELEKDMADNWFALARGHTMEDLWAQVFAKKTGWKVINDTNMYRHPLFPFMIADYDRVLELPGGMRCGLEIKDITDNPHSRELWTEGTIGQGGSVPIQYEIQARHYMAVANLDRWYFIAGYGKTPSEHYIVICDRDLEIEEKLIMAEKDFWENHVVPKIPVHADALTDASLSTLSKMLLRRKPAPRHDATPDEMVLIREYLSLHEKQKAFEGEAKKIKEEKNAVELKLREMMGQETKMIIPDGDKSIIIKYAPQMTYSVDRDALKFRYPDIYSDVVVENPEGKRPFSIAVKDDTDKKSKPKKAANG